MAPMAQIVEPEPELILVTEQIDTGKMQYQDVIERQMEMDSGFQKRLIRVNGDLKEFWAQ